MAISTVVIISLSVLISSWVSGAFGMAGGLILMVVLLQYLPIGTALVTHAFLQLFTNVLRTYLNFSKINWGIFTTYSLGNLAAFIAFLFIDVEVSKKIVLLTLGGFSLIMPFCKYSPINIFHKKSMFSVGVITGGLQFATGVGGPLFNIVFLNKKLGREEVIATKSAISALSLVFKIIYFYNLFLQETVSLDLMYITPILLIFGIVGTQWSQDWRQKIGERRFLTVSRWLVSLMGFFCLWEGF